MFGIHGDDHPPGLSRRTQQIGARADQAFLVGQGHDRAGAGGGQGRRQACEADDGRHHPLGLFRRRLDSGLGPGRGFDSGPGEQGAKLRQGGLVADHRDPRAPPQGLLRQPLDVPPRGQGGHRDLDPRLLEHIKRRNTHRAGGAEDADLTRKTQCPHPR